MQTTKTVQPFLRFCHRVLLGILSILCAYVCLGQLVLDENSCSSIFIGMFGSHYWPAFRLWSAMHYMLPSTLSLMWPLLLSHWQCNLTRLMTCSMTSLGEASRSQPHWGVWSEGGMCELQDPSLTSWSTTQIGLFSLRDSGGVCLFCVIFYDIKTTHGTYPLNAPLVKAGRN